MKILAVGCFGLVLVLEVVAFTSTDPDAWVLLPVIVLLAVIGMYAAGRAGR